MWRMVQPASFPYALISRLFLGFWGIAFEAFPVWQPAISAIARKEVREPIVANNWYAESLRIIGMLNHCE